MRAFIVICITLTAPALGAGLAHLRASHGLDES